MYQDESNPSEESEGIGDTQICKIVLVSLFSRILLTLEFMDINGKSWFIADISHISILKSYPGSNQNPPLYDKVLSFQQIICYSAETVKEMV